jgi:uncharacterized membrane protein
MVAFIVIVSVGALLSVPIMLIISLLKLSRLDESLSSLGRKIEKLDLILKWQNDANGKETEVEVPKSHEVAAMLVEPETGTAPEGIIQSEEPKIDKTINESTAQIPDEPTALDIFWMRIEDWLAVRGDFAPKGMTREFAFATRWLVRVGVALIVGAIVYFVKLSIDRGWMGPTGRVASTLFWGAVACVGGSYLVKKEKYSLLGHAFVALGVVALYLGFGLGHRFFDPPVIASPVLAFCALATVTFCAGVMSVCLRSPYIAVMGLIGGYLVPVVAGRDSGFPLGLDAYILVLNIGAFYVALKRRWSALNFLASMLAFIVCCIWTSRHPQFGGHAAILVNFVFLSAIHLLYMAGVIIGSNARSKVGNAIAWAGLSVNACCYLGWLACVFCGPFAERTTGLVLLGVVSVYLSVAILAIRRSWADKETVGILLFFALAFLAVTPLLLFGRPWCVVSWSLLAVATAEAESRSSRKLLGIISDLLIAAAAFEGIFYCAPSAYCDRSVQTLMEISGGAYISEFLLRLVRLWTLPVASLLVARRLKINALGVAALIVSFLFFTGEARNFGYVFFPSLKSGSVSVAWLFAAFAGLCVGIVRRSRVLRVTALSLLGVTVAKVLLFDTSHLTTPVRVGLFALSGVLLIIGAFLYMKFKERFEDHA